MKLPWAGIIALIALMYGCERLPMAGGTTDTGNARIAAVIYANDGTRAKGASVILRSKDYLSGMQSAAPQSNQARERETVTDDSGHFEIDSMGIGNYCIEVNDGENSATLIAATVSSATSPGMSFIDTLRPYAGIYGTTGLQPGPSLKMFALVYGLERKTPLDSTGRFEMRDLPSGTLSFRIVSQDTLFKPFDIDSIPLTSGKIDTVPYAGWRFARSIALNSTSSGAGVASTVTGFPVLVRLTSSNFDFSQARADGRDLRFTKSDNTPLPYEIERYDPVTEHAEVWVKVDTVFGNDNTHAIAMYWGNPNVAGSSSGAAVFDTASGFQGVWHLAEAGNTVAKDATINGYNGTLYGMTAASSVPGAIGIARNFDGASGYIQMIGTAAGKLNFGQDGFYAVSAWVYADTLDFGTDSNASRHDLTIVAKDNCQYTLKCFRTDFAFIQYMDAAGWATSMSPAIIATWKYVVGVCAGTRQYLYVDGICTADSVNFFEPSTRPRSMASDVTIGKTPPGTNNWSPYFFKGMVDEVRISNVALSADWIKLCYMNQRIDDKLVIFK